MLFKEIITVRSTDRPTNNQTDMSVDGEYTLPRTKKLLSYHDQIKFSLPSNSSATFSISPGPTQKLAPSFSSSFILSLGIINKGSEKPDILCTAVRTDGRMDGQFRKRLFRGYVYFCCPLTVNVALSKDNLDNIHIEHK